MHLRSAEMFLLPVSQTKYIWPLRVTRTFTPQAPAGDLTVLSQVQRKQTALRLEYAPSSGNEL